MRVLELTPTPRANEFVPEEHLDEEQEVFSLEVMQCRDCGHVQLGEVVDPASMFRDYVYVSGTSPSFVAHFREYAEQLINAYSLPVGSLVVDIGSNDGTLLRAFRDLGFRVLGVDPAVRIAEQATAEGIETLCDFLSPSLAESIVAAHGKCSLVTANNVFAHVDDLQGFVTAVRTLLQADGLFSFEVSYLVDVYQKTLFDTIYHEHLDYHTVAPLQRFFAANGMQLVDAQRISTHGGSLRGIAQLTGGHRAVSPSVVELVELERELGLDGPDAMVRFAGQIGAVRESLATLLRGYRAQGLTVGAYGAPAKATTLMYHFGLDEETIEFVIDDSPLKQGLYTPGMHIPVLPSSAISERRPDVLVILAWNFAEPIIRNNRAFIDGGGRFVVPLPEVTVVEA